MRMRVRPTDEQFYVELCELQMMNLAQQIFRSFITLSGCRRPGIVNGCHLLVIQNPCRMLILRRKMDKASRAADRGTNHPCSCHVPAYYIQLKQAINKSRSAAHNEEGILAIHFGKPVVVDPGQANETASSQRAQVAYSALLFAATGVKNDASKHSARPRNGRVRGESSDPAAMFAPQHGCRSKWRLLPCSAQFRHPFRSRNPAGCAFM